MDGVWVWLFVREQPIVLHCSRGCERDGSVVRLSLDMSGKGQSTWG